MIPGDFNRDPDDYPDSGPTFSVELTRDQAETIINGLRGWARVQRQEEFGDGGEASVTAPDYDPWPSSMAKVADKIALALLEADGEV